MAGWMARLMDLFNMPQICHTILCWSQNSFIMQSFNLGTFPTVTFPRPFPELPGTHSHLHNTPCLIQVTTPMQDLLMHLQEWPWLRRCHFWEDNFVSLGFLQVTNSRHVSICPRTVLSLPFTLPLLTRSRTVRPVRTRTFQEWGSEDPSYTSVLQNCSGPLRTVPKAYCERNVSPENLNVLDVLLWQSFLDFQSLDLPEGNSGIVAL